MDQARPELAVIDYGMSNLRSVCRAWEHVGARIQVVRRPQEIGSANALVFPGQGAIVDTMVQLKATGFDAAIRDWIAADRPYFGICLGLQALFEHSEEGDTPGLGILPGRVVRFRLSREFKIPHMGWNAVEFRADPEEMRAGFDSADNQFYFVHSFHPEAVPDSLIWGETHYGYRFVSAIRSGQCFATQFHPEKSQAKGLQLYRNFLDMLLLPHSE